MQRYENQSFARILSPRMSICPNVDNSFITAVVDVTCDENVKFYNLNGETVTPGITSYIHFGNNYGIVVKGGKGGIIMSVEEKTSTLLDDAESWCAGLGSVWQFPTTTQMRNVYNNMQIINTRLQALGKTTISKKQYWAHDSARNYYVDMSTGGVGCSYADKNYRAVRAVRVL